jgi:centrin-3
MIKAFHLFDEEKSGKIGPQQIKKVAKELGETIPDDEIEAMIEEFDTDKDGFS